MTAQEIIKELMKQEGLSQYALSSMAVMKRTTLQTVLLDGRDMSVSTVQKIMKVLKGSLEIGGREGDAQDIVRGLMREKGITHAQLATLCGFKNRQSVTQGLAGHMRMEMLLTMVHAMGEKVVIRHNGEEWEVS